MTNEEIKLLKKINEGVQAIRWGLFGMSVAGVILWVFTMTAKS